MSWKIQKNIITNEPEISISGFEKGIADSPYEGLADVRNANILTSPKQASVGWASTAVTLPPSGYTGVAWSSASASDVVTVPSTVGWYTGMAVIFDTVSATGGGATAGFTYYVGNISGNTFIPYRGMDIGIPVDFIKNLTGTLSVPTLGTPSDSVCFPGQSAFGDDGIERKDTVVMTSDGLLWRLASNPVSGNPGGSYPVNTLQFLGNSGHSTVGNGFQTGLAIYDGYLFAFYGTKIDYLPITFLHNSQPASGAWVYGWKTITASIQGHRALSATDNALYWCNNTTIGSVLENAGTTFDPTDSSTYTFNNSALKLPGYESATCLAQLGTTLLIGGVLQFVYPWNRVSTSFNYPLILPENYTKCIVSSNSTSYIFAGTRGFIYLTNGSNIDVFKKIPDSLANVVDPYYTWSWATYWKEQLYFTFYGRDNSLNAIANFAGIWAIDLVTEAFRLTNSLSYGNYGGKVPVLFPMGTPYQTGDGLYTGWLTASATAGIDFTSPSPYVNYETRIDTDLMNIGTFLNPNTFSNVEFKLSKPLVTGESVRISYRSNLNDAFTVIFTSSTAGALSDLSSVNFQGVQWLQLRIEMSSTASNPSYVLLREVLIRN